MKTKKRQHLTTAILIVFMILLTAGILYNVWAIAQLNSRNASVPSSPTPEATASPTAPAVDPFDPALLAKVTPATSYGHFYYPEADPKNLFIVSSYGLGQYQDFERMQPEASLALMKMIYAAREDGVWIIPASAFRSVKVQEQLFQKQVSKQGSPEQAAKISAPPNYSEHHTGYAVDLADGSSPSSEDITLAFAETKAYQWLTENAKKFGFEMSFPANNQQGVSYEPWHWRYVGSDRARGVFRRARSAAGLE